MAEKGLGARMKFKRKRAKPNNPDKCDHRKVSCHRIHNGERVLMGYVCERCTSWWPVTEKGETK